MNISDGIPRVQDISNCIASEPGSNQNTYALSNIAPTVTSKWSKGSGGPSGSECGNLDEVSAPILVRMREGKEGGGKGPLVSSDQSLTLATGNDQVLCFKTDQEPESHGDISPTLQQPSPSGGGQQHAVMTGMQLRRLTPRECERLQSFPDDYTLIPWRGKPADQCPDGPRYKALGNSWCVNEVKKLAHKINIVRQIKTGMP